MSSAENKVFLSLISVKISSKADYPVSIR